MSADLVLARGSVATEDGLVEADILVKDGVILDLVDPGAGRGAAMESAEGRIVLPGGIVAGGLAASPDIHHRTGHEHVGLNH